MHYDSVAHLLTTAELCMLQLLTYRQSGSLIARKKLSPCAVRPLTGLKTPLSGPQKNQ